jgi:hypothetical protein
LLAGIPALELVSAARIEPIAVRAEVYEIDRAS